MLHYYCCYYYCCYCYCYYYYHQLRGNSTLYTRGEVIQCIAYPNRGYTFDSWYDMVKSLSNPLTLEVSQFGTLTANFDPTFPPETYLFIILGSIGSSNILGMIQ